MRTHRPVCLSLLLGLGVDGTAWVLNLWWSDDSGTCVGCMLCYVTMAKGLQILQECQSGVLRGCCQWGNFTLTFCSLPVSANPGSPPQTKCQSHVTFQGGRCQPEQLEFLTMSLRPLLPQWEAEQDGGAIIDCSEGKFISVSHFISSSSLRNLADSFSAEKAVFWPWMDFCLCPFQEITRSGIKYKWKFLGKVRMWEHGWRK